MPAKTKVALDRALLNVLPIMYVAKTATNPPTNAARGSGSINQFSVVDRRNVKTSVAPSPAPAATPNKYGSTNGLRKTP